MLCRVIGHRSALTLVVKIVTNPNYELVGHALPVLAYLHCCRQSSMPRSWFTFPEPTGAYGAYCRRQPVAGVKKLQDGYAIAG